MEREGGGRGSVKNWWQKAKLYLFHASLKPVNICYHLWSSKSPPKNRLFRIFVDIVVVDDFVVIVVDVIVSVVVVFDVVVTVVVVVK